MINTFNWVVVLIVILFCKADASATSYAALQDMRIVFDGSGSVNWKTTGTLYQCFTPASNCFQTNTGAIVTLTATPAAGWKFKGWGNSLASCGTNNPCIYTAGSGTNYSTTIIFGYDGVCGPNNGKTVTSSSALSAGGSNYCSVGSPSSLSGSGPWSWTCYGDNGTNAKCSANITTYTISTSVAGGNGTITCKSPVNYNSISGCTIAPASGYKLASLLDNGNAQTINPSVLYYNINNVTANHSITATFSPIPINGACGTSNTQTFNAIPTANLCTSGTVSTVTGTGPWNWTCNGINGGTTASCIANLDNTPPNLTLSTLSDSSKTSSATLNMAGTVTDAGSGIKNLTVNGQSVSVASDGSFSTAVTLSLGTNTLTTIATDNANNTKTDTRTLSYGIAPTITLSQPADNSITPNPFVDVTGSINDATATVVATINGGTPLGATKSGTSFNVRQYLVAGQNTIEITSTNLAGYSSSIKRTIIYDSSAPSLAITCPDQDISTSYSGITIIGSVTDLLSKTAVSISVNGQQYTPSIGTDGIFKQTVNLPSNMTYTFLVTATDQANNSITVRRNVIKGSSVSHFTINDALKALKSTVGTATLTPAEKISYDVAPLDVNGHPVGNGIIDAADVILILRRNIGMGNW